MGHIYSFIFLYVFLMQRESVIRPVVIIIPRVWTVWIIAYYCVHQWTISAAAGFEPGTPGLWVNHATNKLTWHHIMNHEQRQWWSWHWTLYETQYFVSMLSRCFTLEWKQRFVFTRVIYWESLKHLLHFTRVTSVSLYFRNSLITQWAPSQAP